MMEDNELRSIVENEIRTSIGFLGGELSEDRRKAMQYYLGDPFGNEIEGRSGVVSTDVQDTIESMMPDFMEMFSGGDTVVRFDPTSIEDEEFSKMATDYVNYIWNVDNEGFANTHDGIKDALLQKTGIYKAWWDESAEQKRDTYENLSTLQVQELEADETVEIIEYETKPSLEAPDGVLHDLTLIRTKKKGRIKVVCIPPEEFLITRRAVELEDSPFTCHKVRKTVSDLIQEGYDPEVLRTIPSHDDQDYNEERIARFDEDEWPELDDDLDPAMREIWLYECYLKVDFDEDNVAEMRQVTVAGPGYRILENIEIDDHPFSAITPIKMPHKFFGRSVADLVMDVQLIKSTIQRQLLDNMYLTNNARTAINERVDLDDYLTNRPGGAVRVEGVGPVGDSIQPLQTTPLGPQAFNQLEYWDGVREMRTGVTRLNQGMDADSLNKTASGINQLLGRTQRRMLLIARVFAETGFKKIFGKILRLVITHQDRERVIRLRNKWVPMDPKYWNADMDVSVSVGLGHGTAEQKAMLYRMFLELQKEIVGFQGGVNGPLVNMDNIHNTLEKFVHASGEKDARPFFSDPANQPPPPPPEPDPDVIEAQQKQQLEMAKLQQDQQQFIEEIKFKYAELSEKYRTEDSRQDLKAQELAVDAAHTASEHGIKRVEADAKLKAAERPKGETDGQ